MTICLSLAAATDAVPSRRSSSIDPIGVGAVAAVALLGLLGGCTFTPARTSPSDDATLERSSPPTGAPLDRVATNLLAALVQLPEVATNGVPTSVADGRSPLGRALVRSLEELRGSTVAADAGDGGDRALHHTARVRETELGTTALVSLTYRSALIEREYMIREGRTFPLSPLAVRSTLDDIRELRVSDRLFANAVEPPTAAAESERARATPPMPAARHDSPSPSGTDDRWAEVPASLPSADAPTRRRSADDVAASPAPDAAFGRAVRERMLRRRSIELDALVRASMPIGEVRVAAPGEPGSLDAEAERELAVLASGFRADTDLLTVAVCGGDTAGERRAAQARVVEAALVAAGASAARVLERPCADTDRRGRGSEAIVVLRRHAPGDA